MARDRVIELAVNGEPVRALVPIAQTLLELLRGPLDLTGTKHGCDVGDCGACTVLVGGQPRLSCITLALDCAGARVETVEGVGGPEGLDAIQAAFDHHVAAQCGYCTPGFVMTLRHLFAENPGATEAELREALGSNLCRCTGYTKILAAAREAQAAYAGKA
jgi:aerobic-type carbon monoxide dehydrogenase small subunit (CoxS/CutS family)